MTSGGQAHPNVSAKKGPLGVAVLPSEFQNRPPPSYQEGTVLNSVEPSQLSQRPQIPVTVSSESGNQIPKRKRGRPRLHRRDKQPESEVPKCSHQQETGIGVDLAQRRAKRSKHPKEKPSPAPTVKTDRPLPSSRQEPASTNGPPPTSGQASRAREGSQNQLSSGTCPSGHGSLESDSLRSHGREDPRESKRVRFLVGAELFNALFSSKIDANSVETSKQRETYSKALGGMLLFRADDPPRLLLSHSSELWDAFLAPSLETVEPEPTCGKSSSEEPGTLAPPSPGPSQPPSAIVASCGDLRSDPASHRSEISMKEGLPVAPTLASDCSFTQASLCQIETNSAGHGLAGALTPETRPDLALPLGSCAHRVTCHWEPPARALQDIEAVRDMRPHRSWSPPFQCQGCSPTAGLSALTYNEPRSGANHGIRSGGEGQCCRPRGPSPSTPTGRSPPCHPDALQRGPTDAVHTVYQCQGCSSVALSPPQEQPLSRLVSRFQNHPRRHGARSDSRCKAVGPMEQEVAPSPFGSQDCSSSAKAQSSQFHSIWQPTIDSLPCRSKCAAGGQYPSQEPGIDSRLCGASGAVEPLQGANSADSMSFSPPSPVGDVALFKQRTCSGMWDKRLDSVPTQASSWEEASTCDQTSSQTQAFSRRPGCFEYGRSSQLASPLMPPVSMPSSRISSSCGQVQPFTAASYRKVCSQADRQAMPGSTASRYTTFGVQEESEDNEFTAFTIAQGSQRPTVPGVAHHDPVRRQNFSRSPSQRQPPLQLSQNTRFPAEGRCVMGPPFSQDYTSTSGYLRSNGTDPECGWLRTTELHPDPTVSSQSQQRRVAPREGDKSANGPFAFSLEGPRQSSKRSSRPPRKKKAVATSECSEKIQAFRFR
ncbi:hypothetical protein CSUI_008492 [Cystoisospora suis]|uniref:Uncharacterized protein n=1 Tax=Cystoisospora suis TaxID=483139 RepID=A0A2C6KM28_9APIC|nr:hypothetical protein CSUI_008492 [Cystoisospora suis]